MSEYDTDILMWSEHQAALLRRIAAGEPVNGSPDWSNIIEEVGDVGLNSLRTCRSLLVQALLHMLKAEAWPTAREVSHWRAEARDSAGMQPTHFLHPCGSGLTWQSSIEERCVLCQT